MELGLSGSSRFSKRIFSDVPWALLLVALGIAALGVWNLASASRSAHAAVWRSQLAWMGVGLALCALTCVLDYRYLLNLAYPIYAVLIVMLVLVLVKGRAIMGAQRWLELGPLRLQPSELMKIGIILTMARFFHEDRERTSYGLADLWMPALLLLVPVALVMKQPDLGTAMLIASCAGTMILFSRVRWKTLATLAVGFVGVSIVAWNHVLKDYQKKRVLTFLDPEGDTLGAGYHASQSLIAVGSGQGWGKGWGEGTQTQLSFLPEQHTDFIFSVWGEEHGFAGAMVLLGLYMLLLLLCIGVAASAREKFGSYLCVGVAGMIFWHVFINIGMVTGVLPVVGVTLPLMSYGGSSVITVMLGLGLL
ncbi:MAG: rod shape-determining protein RodA, partial [Myxococcales bacterium]